MLNHWLAMPIVLPLAIGALLVVLGERWQRGPTVLSVGSLAAQAVLALLLVVRASAGEVDVYLLGNWAVPFGIAIALDRLSAMMVALTTIAALVCAAYAWDREDRRGPHFHALLQFQVAGLAGAFLTADLFNLFVFFELLLIASYGLLVHGAGHRRLRAAMHYVTFNLVASAFFLIAVAVLYAVTGTLSIAELAVRVPELSGLDATLAHSALALLFIVFGVKAAMLPLYFWLPDTYSAVTAPVAALFAVLTKVGVYALARMLTLLELGPGDPVVPWLPTLATATIVLAAAGALAAGRLRTLIAYLVVTTAGTLLLGVALGTLATIAAALFYLVHSTLVTMALFLLVERIGVRRGALSDRLDAGAWQGGARLAIGGMFAVLACAAAGLPPFAGFLGKALLLDATIDTPFGFLIWAVVLFCALAVIVALARAGAVLFWEGEETTGDEADPPARVRTPHRHAAMGLAVGAVVACAVFAGPLSSYTQAAAAQLLSPERYIAAVTGERPATTRWSLRDGVLEEAKP